MLGADRCRRPCCAEIHPPPQRTSVMRVVERAALQNASLPNVAALCRKRTKRQTCKGRPVGDG